MKYLINLLFLWFIGLNAMGQAVGSLSIHRKKPFINSEEIDNSGGYGLGYTHRFNSFLGLGIGARLDGYDYTETVDWDVSNTVYTEQYVDFKSSVDQLYVTPILYFPIDEEIASFYIEAELGTVYHSVEGDFYKETKINNFYTGYWEKKTEKIKSVKDYCGRNFTWAVNIGLQVLPLEGKKRLGMDFYLGYSSVNYTKSSNHLFKEFNLETQKKLTVLCGGVTIRCALYK